MKPCAQLDANLQRMCSELEPFVSEGRQPASPKPASSPTSQNVQLDRDLPLPRYSPQSGSPNFMSDETLAQLRQATLRRVAPTPGGTGETMDEADAWPDERDSPERPPLRIYQSPEASSSSRMHQDSPQRA